MSDPVPTSVDAARGPLSSIGDRIAAKEIGKLWDAVEGRFGYQGGNGRSFVTEDRLAAALRSIASGPAIVNPGSLGQGVIGGGASGASSAVGGDITSLNNVWSGFNTYVGVAALGQPAISVQGLGGQAINTGSSILVAPAQYSALVELERVTAIAATTPTGARGISGMVVQHRVSGVGSTTSSAVLAAMETTQNGGGAIGAWTWIGNLGSSVSAAGLNVVAYHNSVSAGVTTGAKVDISRPSAQGSVFGCAVTLYGDASSGLYGIDAAYIAHPTGSANRRMASVFQAGHPTLGSVVCDIGLNLALASCDAAAIVVPNGRLVTLTGANQNVAFLGRSAGNEFELRGNAKAMLTVNPWWVAFYNGSGSMVFGIDGGAEQPIFSPSAVASFAGAASGIYLSIQFAGGGLYKIPLYNYA
jgi:hypothetical protein